MYVRLSYFGKCVNLLIMNVPKISYNVLSSKLSHTNILHKFQYEFNLDSPIQYRGHNFHLCCRCSGP